MTVWSPSHVNKWLECPLKWDMQRRGVEGVREKWSPGMVVGTALHAGLAQEFSGNLEGVWPAEVAERALEGVWPSEDAMMGEFTYEGVSSKMQGALQRAIAKRGELLGEDGQVVGTEVKLGEGDRESGQYPGTADLITSHGEPQGIGDGGRYLVVTDWKSHWALDEYYVEKELSETERNWQLHQYAYFAEKMYSLPVKYIRKVTIRCLPSPKVWVYTHAVNEDRLWAWFEHARGVWDKMTCDVIEEDFAPNWQSCRKYGRCEYYHVCH